MNVAEMMLSHRLMAMWMLVPRPRLWLDDMYYRLTLHIMAIHMVAFGHVRSFGTLLCVIERRCTCCPPE